MTKIVNMAYLCGPIDMDRSIEKDTWRKVIAEKLIGIGVSSYTPIGAFNIADKTDAAEHIYAINNAALEYCDVVIVYVNPDIFTIGSFMELERAKQMGKPVLLFMPQGKNLDAAYLFKWPRFEYLEAITEYIGWINEGLYNF